MIDIKNLVKDKNEDELTSEDILDAAEEIDSSTKEIVEAFDAGIISSGDTLKQLSALMDQSVQKQMIIQPKLYNLQDNLIELLSRPEEIKAMDHATIIKLVEVSHRLTSQPLDQLVKLAQVIKDLHDIKELESQKESLERIAAELKDKLDQVNVLHTTPEVHAEHTVEDAEIA